LCAAARYGTLPPPGEMKAVSRGEQPAK